MVVDPGVVDVFGAVDQRTASDGQGVLVHGGMGAEESGGESFWAERERYWCFAV